ncbi:hypothetical protein PoB_004381900 [Plakobranchus ocellatus]|uniref:Uncharacterized protein n=1 Tax=Plakobranchus ocellatus TaxID=259542 RepID=A0AAV4BAZ7_9GAST|nr:hypothetical protein PoB_004381900 [Plakobranchus ocellatus]
MINRAVLAWAHTGGSRYRVQEYMFGNTSVRLVGYYKSRRLQCRPRLTATSVLHVSHSKSRSSRCLSALRIFYVHSSSDHNTHCTLLSYNTDDAFAFACLKA